MKITRLLVLTIAVTAFIGLGTAYPVDSGSLSCQTYDEHSIDVSGITYSDDTSNNGDTERYMSPGEEVTIKFEYNLPACDNAVDHSSHLIKFYDGQGRFLGQKTDVQMKQGNWDSYTTYEIPVVIPEFNTSEVRVVMDVRANSVHGSDVWYENKDESDYDRVIVDTMTEARDRLDLEELPISQEDRQMLKNTETTEDFWSTCASLDYTVNNDSYVDTDMPGFRVSAGDWNMDSGGGHPCYIFSAYQQAMSLYNFYEIVDYNGEGDGQIGKAGTCGPNPNNQHNGGGISEGHDRTFGRACPDYDGEWIASDSNVACDGGERKNAADYEGEIIEVEQDGETIQYVSDGREWLSVRDTDTDRNVCEAFADAQGQGGWAEGEIVEEESGLAGARCNLALTQDSFIVGQTLYEDGESVDCSSPTGVERSVTINGTEYYCKGVAE